MPQKPEARRSRYWELDAAGLCVQCAKPRDGLTKMCGHCMSRSRRASATWKAKVGGYDKLKALRRKYGLTPDDWNRMLAEQGGGCALCGTTTPVAGGWQVDHCHRTGCVRALLCRLCNVGLGSFKDNPDLLERAAAYLRKHKALRAV